ncbi:N-terminal methionine N(alpha)-acetyltransferase NatE [Malassezia obtusa]|uniref:Pre-mRNA-splicing factor CWC24 n=1 Tax=Malassezia obtusa TaxID=76774 RepID=A0AAF0ITI1_9BASI|nr:N-terminal methionine N(alpha)-acetyltransferase NatE [Malassezia obtusa]
MDVVFKKKARGARDVRKRPADADADADADEGSTKSAVVSKKTRAATPEDEPRAARAPDRFGQTTVHASARADAAPANANANRADATRDTAWDLEQEYARELGTDTRPKPTNDDGKYRGLAGYAKYTEERDDGSSAKFRTKGPMQAPTNVRTITVVDYQPDVCKDYKETGYCGFGDTCKFLHDRSDYLAGWQLEASGDAADARAGTYGAGLEAEDDEEEEVPFACLLCRRPFTDPVVTLCGHYFCAPCAVQRFAKTPKCFACGAKTHGLFNSATKILDRMARRNASRAEERRDARVRHGLEDEHEVLDGVVVDEP